MAKIERIAEVRKALQARAGKYGPAQVSWVVGFQTQYALVVHERLDVHHPVGQAKYLEQPARTLQKVFAALVTGMVKKGATLVQALGVAALRLQRESQILTPVDTGLLKNSAFTTREK